MTDSNKKQYDVKYTKNKNKFGQYEKKEITPISFVLSSTCHGIRCQNLKVRVSWLTNDERTYAYEILQKIQSPWGNKHAKHLKVQIEGTYSDITDMKLLIFQL